MALEWPKMIQNGPKMTQNAPKWPKYDPKWPKITPNGPEMTPGFTYFVRSFFDWKGGSANFFAFRMYDLITLCTTYLAHFYDQSYFSKRSPVPPSRFSLYRQMQFNRQSPLFENWVMMRRVALIHTDSSITSYHRSDHDYSGSSWNSLGRGSGSWMLCSWWNSSSIIISSSVSLKWTSV